MLAYEQRAALGAIRQPRIEWKPPENRHLRGKRQTRKIALRKEWAHGVTTVAVEAEHVFDQPEHRDTVMDDSLERVTRRAHAGFGGTRNHHHAGQLNQLGEA